MDRLVGIVDAHVDMHPEDQLLARDEAQRGDQVAVARPSGDSLVLPEREGVRAGRADRQPALGGPLAHLAAQRAELGAGLGGVGARIGGDLEHRLHELGLDLPLRGILEQRLDGVDQVQGLGVDDHQLFLDADGAGRPDEVVGDRSQA
jgi:hypothetical protein